MQKEQDPGQDPYRKVAGFGSISEVSKTTDPVDLDPEQWYDHQDIAKYIFTYCILNHLFSTIWAVMQFIILLLCCFVQYKSTNNFLFYQHNSKKACSGGLQNFSDHRIKAEMEVNYKVYSLPVNQTELACDLTRYNKIEFGLLFSALHWPVHFQPPIRKGLKKFAKSACRKLPQHILHEGH
jgi:hypothetical protein